MITRSQKWNLLSDSLFDVAVVGGGINGAAVYHKLCSEGYRVLLVDKGDFSSGTSQASAMMAWGGLLYLSSLDLSTVWQLSMSRDDLVKNFSASVSPRRFRYVSKRNKVSILAALYLYWLVGLGRRRRPYRDQHFPESQFLQKDFGVDSLVYEEACLEQSDARFVLNWILEYQNEFHLPLNYCALQSCVFDSSSKLWQLDLKNTIDNRQTTTRARLVINAAGVWTDGLNAQTKIETPYKHIYGKGVFLGFRRFDGHEFPLIVDAGVHTQSLCLIPWGPVSLWGPTETKLDSLDSAFHVDPDDVRLLLSRLNQHTQTAVAPSDIVSLRCGVRPLAVERSYNGAGPTLQISRRHRILADGERPWISLYGGKITSCVPLALETSENVHKWIEPMGQIMDAESNPDPMCCTLEDYVRRRTNIAQWQPRGGLGLQNEGRSELLSIAMQIHGDPLKAQEDLTLYETKIKKEFDDVIQEVA